MTETDMAPESDYVRLLENLKPATYSVQKIFAQLEATQVCHGAVPAGAAGVSQTTAPSSAGAPALRRLT